MNILIVGAGSIGKRHARNLHVLGCRVGVVDPRKDRRKELSTDIAALAPSASLEEALVSSWDGAVIATPPAFHVAQTIACLKARIPCYLEKGVCLGVKEARKLQIAYESQAVPVLMGYSWRWHEGIRRVKEMLTRRTIGTVRRAEFTMAAHLADWHPWEPIRDFYIATRGGVENENHWIDIMLWFFGKPDEAMAVASKISDLDIDQNDNYNFHAVYEQGMEVDIHLDLYRRPHNRSFSIYGENGTINWTPKRTEVFITEPERKIVIDDSEDRNEMFMAAMVEFVNMLNYRSDMRAPPSLTCTLKEGVDVIELMHEAKHAG